MSTDAGGDLAKVANAWAVGYDAAKAAADDLLREVLSSPTNHTGSRSVGDRVVPYQAKRLSEDLLRRIREYVASDE